MIDESTDKKGDPKRVRAPRRVGAPRAPRGVGDLAAERALARSLKAPRIVLPPLAKDAAKKTPAPKPRVRVKRRPRKGYRHAVTRDDIATTARFFGETCTYGVRSIELVASPADPSHGLHLGKLLVPGQTILFPQPIGPWRLPGRVSISSSGLLIQ